MGSADSIFASPFMFLICMFAVIFLSDELLMEEKGINFVTLIKRTVYEKIISLYILDDRAACLDRLFKR